MLETVARVLSFPFGILIIVWTLFSAIRTFVLPRSARDPLTQYTFRMTRRLFNLFGGRSRSYAQRDRVMALYAPVTLLIMPVVWLTLLTIGYACLFWATGIEDIGAAFKLSGSSLLTLGFTNTEGLLHTQMAFSEATIGLMMIALLIAYLPTMYTAFSQRETAIALLEVRAGSPPFCVEMFLRYKRIGSLDLMQEAWVEWERWFVYLDETHTSLAALNFFRSPQPDRSWVTAAGTVLDAAAFASSTLDIPPSGQARLCLRAGYTALRHICDFFELPYPSNPKSGDPITISRDEFDEACEQLRQGGVPLKADLDQAWIDFAGWRVNYDVPLVSLAALTMAPYAPWSSDRGISPLVSELFQEHQRVKSKWLGKEGYF